MKRIRSYGPSLVLLATVVAVLVAGPTVGWDIAFAQKDANIKRIKNDLQQSDLLTQLSNAYTQVAKAVEPSVVNIEVLSRGGNSATDGRHQLNPRDLERWFFGPNAPGQGQGRGGGEGLEQFRRRMPDEGRPGQDRSERDFDRFNPPRPRGSGAGWVYDKQHIITNNHVVQHADEIRVIFHDGTKRDADVVGTDPRTDVAVLRVKGGRLHPASVSTKGVTQGQVVLAFGSPFRFDFSMSQGIVSAQGRRLGITGRNGYERFIQTDAAVNPGNSGGPLVNIKGQVIGMNTAIASKTGMFSGLGFAIPAKLVTNVADQIISGKGVQRGYLGVYIEDLSAQMAKTFDYDGDGALVVNPIKGSPAAKAGLKPGDIVTKVNGHAVQDASGLRFAIAGMKPDSKAKLKVIRKGKTKTLTVTLGSLPDQAQRLSMHRGANDDQKHQNSNNEAGRLALKKLGITEMQSMNEQLAQRLPLGDEDEAQGVVIGKVRPRSIAANKGLSRGDIITAVMGESVEDMDDLLDELNSLDLAEPVRLTVRQINPRESEYTQRFVVVQFPEDEN